MRRQFILAIFLSLIAQVSIAHTFDNDTSSQTRIKPHGHNRKTVGIVVDLDSMPFSIRTVGMTVFGNESNSANMNWSLNSAVTAQIAGILKPGYNSVALYPSKEALASLKKTHPRLFGGDEQASNICKVLQSASPAHNVDYYIRVYKGANVVGNTNQEVEGIGILHRPGLNEGYTYIHALLYVQLLDGKTCESRSIAPLLQDANKSGMLLGPHQEVNASWLAAAKQGKLDNAMRGIVVGLINKGMAHLLPEVMATIED